MKPIVIAVALSLSLAACKDKGKSADPSKEKAGAAATKDKAKDKDKAPASMGQLMVDGTPFVITSCSPGSKFVGFDLRSADKRRLWVSAAPPGRARVHVFRSPALPVELGPCAEAEVNEIPPPVGGVTGSFTASCDAVGHTVTGSVTVTDCH